MKIFIVEYINTAIIILLMNMQWELKIFEIPVIAGQYSEFSTDWYRMVGSTIVFTMIIRIITSQLVNMEPLGMQYLKRLWDTKCTFN
jgi:hypothetical protein